LPVPGTPDVPLQFIDVRDLARFALDLLQQQRSGTWNVVTPPGSIRMGAFLRACAASARRQAPPPQPLQPVWIPTDFIRRQGIDPWLSFPLWPGNPDEPEIMSLSAHRALAAGQRNLPLQATVEDTMKWLLTLPESRARALVAGLNGEPQSALLAAWRAAQR
jgi:nucleoside-diphosphate-sugar epimerase